MCPFVGLGVPHAKLRRISGGHALAQGIERLGGDDAREAELRRTRTVPPAGRLQPFGVDIITGRGGRERDNNSPGRSPGVRRSTSKGSPRFKRVEVELAALGVERKGDASKALRETIAFRSRGANRIEY